MATVPRVTDIAVEPEQVASPERVIIWLAEIKGGVIHFIPLTCAESAVKY